MYKNTKKLSECSPTTARAALFYGPLENRHSGSFMKQISNA